MDRQQFLQLLAEFIQQEVQSRSKEKIDAMNEPYRQVGYDIVDEALDLIP